MSEYYSKIIDNEKRFTLVCKFMLKLSRDSYQQNKNFYIWIVKAGISHERKSRIYLLVKHNCK